MAMTWISFVAFGGHHFGANAKSNNQGKKQAHETRHSSVPATGPKRRKYHGFFRKQKWQE
jgi:hypothetical protein